MIGDVVSDIREGKMVIITDDEDRENEGDFVIAAEKVTVQDIRFMTMWGGGIICVPLTEGRARELQLPLMVPGRSIMRAAFTVSVDLIAGNTSGASAFDRANTARALACPGRRPQDFCRPGHLFPLIAREGGVLTRRGHTEAAVDLMQLAGLYPVAVICEIMNDQGEMASGDDLRRLAREFQIKVGSVADLVAFRGERP